jgi:hypothetical protein
MIRRTREPDARTVYSTCLYCNQPLGANEVIESFPVGRRLAFDQAKGRLWVVCRKCEKWNLTPFEERWDAIEDCERRYRDARKRVSTDNIGLARLTEGLELVRIGEPLRPEFAAWRYGDQFGRRQRRALLIGSGLALAGGGLVAAGAFTGVLSGSGWVVYQGFQASVTAIRRRRLVCVVTAPSGSRLTVRGRHVEKAQFVPPAPDSDQWGLQLPYESGGREDVAVLYGDHARRATALIMPKVNAGGASRAKVQQAVRRLEEEGDPARYLERLARQAAPGPTPRSRKRWAYEAWGAKKTGTRPSGLAHLGIETRLAVEMAVNEENERIALQGELALLELEWKEAEEIAAIADRLGMPAEVDAQLADLRSRSERP